VNDTEVHALVEQCLAGSGAARPGTDNWESRYARLLGAIEVLADERRVSLPAPLEERWLDLPPIYELRTRPRWPERSDPVVHVRVREYWPGHKLRIRTSPRGHESVSASFAADDAWVLAGIDLPPGAHEIVIDVGLERVAAQPDGSVGTIELVGQDVVTLPVEVGGTIDDVLPPVSMTAMDAIMRDGLVITYRQGRFERPSLMIETGSTAVPVFDGVAIGVHLDIMRDDVALDSVTCAWPGGRSASAEPIRVAINDDAAAALRQDDTSGIQVRVGSDPAAALWVIDATRRWSGEVTVPLR
ncbi:MAG: hypothetical protein ACYTGG_08680, partial [Planctomycetota bacterium]|jgi:hypothetical protein